MSHLPVRRASRSIDSSTARPTTSEPDSAVAERGAAYGGGPAAAGHSLQHVAIAAPQAKLLVNEPGDACEQEADAVADQILRTKVPGPHTSNASDQIGAAVPTVAARKANSDPGPERDVSEVVGQGLADGGRPLDPATRAYMEPRFGHDFSEVRIHTGAPAAQSAVQLAARAYTVGQDIAFRPGAYDPGSDDGRHLLAHELTHVVQQTGNVQRDPTSDAPAAAPPPAAPAAATAPPAPAAAAAPPATVKPARDLNLIVVDINNQYQTLFDKQQEAVTELKSDFDKTDEPSTTDMLMQAAIGLALGQASTALAGVIGTAAGNAASDFILNRALKVEAAGGTPDMDRLVFDSAAAKAKAVALAGAGGAWISGKAKEQVPKAFQSVATSKKESQKFLESHRKSLIDMKAAAQSELLREIAPGFQALPPNEGAVAAERFLAGVEKAHEQALQIQYLQSVAQWGQLISGGTGADLTAAQKGVLRMTYTADSPTGTLKIVKASLEDMDKDVLDRIHGSQTLASMKLADLPISKVFMGDGGLEGPPFIVVMPGQSPEPRTMGPWMDQRGEKYGIDKSNMSRYGYQTVAALMVGEMANLTLGELGLIKGGTGGN